VKVRQLRSLSNSIKKKKKKLEGKYIFQICNLIVQYRGDIICEMRFYVPNMEEVKNEDGEVEKPKVVVVEEKEKEKKEGEDADGDGDEKEETGDGNTPAK